MVLLPTQAAPPTRRVVVATTLAFTFLNPHVYLDTVLLLGSIGNQYGPDRWLFALGACAGSILWFTTLGYGAKVAAPLMSRAITWRILDIAIGIVMLLIAWSLVRSDLAN
jgi:L-lysine exporter family protein LysE/ArgO